VRPTFRGGYGTRDATAVADFAIEMGRAIAGARSSQIRRPEITTHPAKPRRAPRSVVFEAHVGVEPAPRAPLAKLPVLAATVYDVLPLDARLDRVALIDSATGELWPVEG
jgi:hypothetical protein